MALKFDRLCDDCDNSSVCLKNRRCSHKLRRLKRQETGYFFHWLGADAETTGAQPETD